MAVQRIIIRYLGGRGDQVNEFPVGNYELIAGRDPGAHIRFDPDRDDLVSRQHSKIIRDPVDGNSFQLVDLGSRNGTFLNQQRVCGSVRINHNDVVQLGAGGPEFRFELDPPPFPSQNTMGEPAFGLASAIGLKPTRESWVPDPKGAPRPVGRFTVERMLGDVFTRVKHESDRSLWIGLVALFAIVLVGGGTWLYMRQSQSELKSNLSAVQEQNAADMQRVGVELKKGPEAVDEAKKEVERLEKALRESDVKNEANQRSLMIALEAQKKQAAALAKALEQQKEQAAQTPPAPPRSSAPSAPLTLPDASSFETVMAQVQQKMEQGQASAAIELALRLIQIDGSRWEGYALSAESASKLNDYKLAVDMYQRAIAHAPADSRSRLEERLKQVQESAQK